MRALQQLGRNLLDRLGFTLELESEILERATHDELTSFLLRIICDFRDSTRRVAANEMHRDLRAFDSSSRIP